MTKDQKDNLFLLVKSLTKSEKRQFKLYVGRLGVNSDSKFLNVFNVLDKLDQYNEANILKLTNVKKQQLANVKAHLYKQILISLKLNPSHQNIRYQVREQLDFASILYHKGLYKQSKELSAANLITSKLSNLSLQLYGIFLTTGYIKNAQEGKRIKDYFESHLPKYDIKKISFRERLWLYKAHLWYNFLMQDFLRCYKYASKWVNLFYDYPSMISLNPVFFIKGNSYLLESLFLLKNKTKFETIINKFESVITDEKFSKNENVEALSFLYINLNKINLYFIDGSFDKGLELIPEVETKLLKYRNRIDEHHKMVFYYKFASLHFGSGDNKECIRYLDKIITNKSLSMREDLLCFSRVLNLVAHYEAGLDDHLESLLRSTYKFLIKMNDLHEVQKEMIKFIRGLQDIYPQDLKKAFKKLYEKLLTYEKDPYEGRAFLYLDIISWLESKIDNKPVNQVVRKKYLASL